MNPLTLKLTANPRQIIAIEKWNDKTTTEICYGGAKYGGKSYLGAALIFHDALVYPGTFYFIAREKLNDIRKYCTPTIAEVFRNWDLDIDRYAKFNGQDNFYECPNDSRVYLLECAYMPGDPLYERFGSMQFTRGWIEEGGEVNVLAKENLAISIGRMHNEKYNLKRKLLITCNPKKNWLYSEFYKPHSFGLLQENKAFIQALPADNTFGSKEYISDLENMKDATMKERLFYGNWEYEDDPCSLIEYNKITDIFTNEYVKPGLKCITADISRFGSDKTIIMLWDGWIVTEIVELNKSDVSNTAQEISNLAKTKSIPRSQIIVDEDGVGGGVKDILRCVGFVNNSIPVSKINEKENYANLKSQCYFKLAERINEGGLYIKTSNEKHKELIIEELEQVKRKSVDTDGKLAVQSKEVIRDHIGRSPDFSDAIMMREYFDLKPKPSAPRSSVV